MKSFWALIIMLYMTADAIAQQKVTVKAKAAYRHRHEEPVFPGAGNSPENEQKYITDNLQYPEFAKKTRIEGTVIIEYTVDAKGNVVSPRIKTAVHPLLDAEAVRLAEQMPQWQPAKSGETPVTCLRTSAIVFKL